MSIITANTKLSEKFLFFGKIRENNNLRRILEPYNQKLSKMYLIKVKTEVFSIVHFGENDYC